MVTNRDDFVIAVRSAFLKRQTQQRFSLLGLILFSILFIILGSLNFKAIDYVKIAIKEVVYRSSFIVSGPESFIKDSYIIIDSHFKLYEENEKNEIELEELKSKFLINEFIVLENRRLKSIIDDYLVKSSEIIAKVLIDKNSPFLKSIVANKGSKNNIKLGMSVLDGEYLVGKVVEVNYLTSRILLLSDLNSKIPVSIEPNGVQSILSGTGKNYGIIQYLKSTKSIDESSVVYTSGSGGMFKAGVPVGKIEDLDLNNELKVSFFSDFTQLNFVKIISYEEARIKAEEELKIKAEEQRLKIEEEKIKAEEEKIKAEEEKIKAEEEKIKAEEKKLKAEEQKLKTEEELKIKAEQAINIKNEEEKIFQELNLIYGKKCKKRLFNNLYKVGTPEYRTCVLNKGPEIQKRKE